MGFYIIVLAVLFVSISATAALRMYAVSRQLIDIPNARSSHSVPTPRGGGVAVVVVFLASLMLMFFLGELSGRWVTALAGSGLLVAVVGFLDDHGHIAARWRLAAHFSAAVWALFWL